MDLPNLNSLTANTTFSLLFLKALFKHFPAFYFTLLIQLNSCDDSAVDLNQVSDVQWGQPIQLGPVEFEKQRKYITI